MLDGLESSQMNLHLRKALGLIPGNYGIMGGFITSRLGSRKIVCRTH